MQKLYTTNDLVNTIGYTKASINIWVANGWLKPCLINDGKPHHAFFFTKAEYDRLMNAVRESNGRHRNLHITLNRTLHMAKDCNAVTGPVLHSMCGCSHYTLRKAMTRLGYPADQAIAVLEEDIDEVKAMIGQVRREGSQSSAAKRSGTRSKQESTGTITLHIKGLTISLDRKDAEALAEELLAQF